MNSTEKETINTSAGSIAVDIEQVNGVTQINIPWLPGKRFGMFAVYGHDDLALFQQELTKLVEGGAQDLQPDTNITALMLGCIAAGTGPERTFRVELGQPGIAHV